MRIKILAGLFVLVLLCVSRAGATDAITEVVSTSPSWETFTNKDGSGLYHEILREVFGLYGVKVRHEYAKSGRGEELVRLKMADMMTCSDKMRPQLVLGRYPMYANDFYVFFKKDRIGEWRGNESLRGKEVLGQPTYYSQENFDVPVTIKEVMTGAQGLTMIIRARSDFYVDDLVLINQSIKESIMPFKRDDFDIKRVGTRSYHPLFNTATERGVRVKKMYEDGIYRLHKEGKLRPIYDKWGYQCPDFDSF